MGNIPSIINVDIVSSEFDTFWKDISLQSSEKSDVLVLTTPFTAHSAEQIQLEKMMLACKLQPDQYLVLHVGKDEKMAWHKIHDAYRPKYVLLLGVMPLQLGISASFRLFSPNNFDGCIFIASLSLDEMELQPDAKKQLWLQGLKPSFADNQ